MKKHAYIISILLLLALTGCARQSVSDFTPYPAQQGVVRLALHPLPASFTTSDGFSVTLDRVDACISTIAPTDTTVGAVAAIRGHTHESEAEATTETSTSTANDPNVGAGDGRALVPLSLGIGRFVDLLSESDFGALSLRAGASTTWRITFAPASHAVGLAALVIHGTIASGAASSVLQVTIADPFSATVAMDDAVAPGTTQTLAFTLHPVHWFEGLALNTLVGSGAIIIGEEQAALHERFLENFKNSVGHPHHAEAAVRATVR